MLDRICIREEISASQLRDKTVDDLQPRAGPVVGSEWQPLPEVFRRLVALNPGAVLLETAKPDGQNDTSFLFLDPVQELVAWSREDLDGLLSQVDRHSSKGKFVAGFFQYECGEHFLQLSPKLANGKASEPLAWLEVFEAPVRFDHRNGVIHGDLPSVEAPAPTEKNPAIIATDGLQISKPDYEARLKRIREYLEDGHTYQVNFTDRICGATRSGPLAVYQTLLRQQPVSFAAYVNRPSGVILSFSPEMFYSVSQGKITVRPMKGTWPRGVDNSGDRDAANQLQSDEKNRSEHVMIVDLLRNDLGRLCEYGSIRVEDLFRVERYNTLLQMTSSISGALRPELKPSEVFRTLFPCGSITGAPKRRTMEIIRELELRPRGIYTGAIGYFGPEGDSCFNVTIRTLTLREEKVTLGVGGGITAGSEIESEYEECRLKGAFLTRMRPPFSLIETMRCERGISLLDSHLRRLAESAHYFDIRYDAAALRADVGAKSSQCGNVVSRVRLELHEDGSWEISTSPLQEVPWSGRILLAPESVNSKDVFLHHKTTNRAFYERHLAAARQDGFDEVLFMNESSLLTEGAISNFFFRIDGQWLTPKLSCGVLPGVQREAMLRTLAGAREAELELKDIVAADQIVACNALRGKRSVHCIQSTNRKMVWASHDSIRKSAVPE